MLVKQYLIDAPNMTDGGGMLSSSPTSNIQYPTELDGLTASDRLHLTQ
jgi:hypothetical protein